MSTSEAKRPHSDGNEYAAASKPTVWRRVRTGFGWTFASIGVLATGLTVGGVVTDVLSFDQTQGGYEAPYTGVTGTPIDWDAADVTDVGFRQSGLVVDSAVNCTTGEITFEFYGQSIPFRVLSERAVAVHKPLEACEKYGFTPDFVPTV